MKLYANGHEVACEDGDGKVVAAFPDVCMSPPPPPVGPVPVPYPNTSFSRDMKQGSKRVSVNGKPVMLRDQSFYATSPLGNEAATRNFGAGVVSHQIAGKTHFISWSMDVQCEGENVPRHIDLTTSNHGSNANNAVPTPNLAQSATGNAGQATLETCPCCNGPLHENQKDPITGEPLERLPEMEFYGRIAHYRLSRRAEMMDILRQVAEGLMQLPPWATKLDAKSGLPVQDNIIRMGDECERDLKKLQELRQKHSNCPNVHDPPDQGCGVHFKVMYAGLAGEARKAFSRRIRYDSIKEWKNRGYIIDDEDKVNHKTPLDAGGCPLSMQNLVPTEVLEGDCLEIEDLQTRIQNMIPPKNNERGMMYR
ncbi:DUF4150 domain-containing protein [Myxococcus sp. CA033]|uniref:PAAR-like domain-containing protein n=1 Tax=Myxococcus sp. CA033 TaxID=2741516 RepID=UPI00157AF953|nr:PAAR-like domain-containing protein [Myxococcus sp. CA033]NTX41325.1 DUF4150 domain-containing protein [Myxococcus sp. CA033]